MLPNIFQHGIHVTTNNLFSCYIDIKVVKLLAVVMAAFIIFTAPYQLFDFWNSLNEIFFKIPLNERTDGRIALIFLAMVSYANSWVNAFIYYSMSE